jgi:hypothetical protein
MNGDQKLPNQVIMEVRDPTDKDKTVIRFTYDAEVAHCKPSWLTVSDDESDGFIGVPGGPSVHCVPKMERGCDLRGVEWVDWDNGGFERNFDCHFDQIIVTH